MYSWGEKTESSPSDAFENTESTSEVDYSVFTDLSSAEVELL